MTRHHNGSLRCHARTTTDHWPLNSISIDPPCSISLELRVLPPAVVSTRSFSPARVTTTSKSVPECMNLIQPHRAPAFRQPWRHAKRVQTCGPHAKQALDVDPAIQGALSRQVPLIALGIRFHRVRDVFTQADAGSNSKSEMAWPVRCRPLQERRAAHIALTGPRTCARRLALPARPGSTAGEKTARRSCLALGHRSPPSTEYKSKPVAPCCLRNSGMSRSPPP